MDRIVGERVAEERKRKGIVQKAMAAAMGISQPQLSLLERAERGWTVDQLCNAAAVLGVEPGELMTARASLDPAEAAVLAALRSGDPLQAMSALTAALAGKR